MSNSTIVHELATAVASLPAPVRPYLLALVLAEKGLSPFLEDLLATLLIDAANFIDDPHMALVAVHVSKRRGDAEAATEHWRVIEAAGTANAARAACKFMAGLPALLRAADEATLH